MSEGLPLVVIDRARCLGSGHCVYAEPRVFDQDDENGIVILVDRHPPGDALDAVRRAVMTCPGQAIELIEDVQARPEP